MEDVKVEEYANIEFVSLVDDFFPSARDLL